MPEIAGLAAVEIPFEAERQENWYSVTFRKEEEEENLSI